MKPLYFLLLAGAVAAARGVPAYAGDLIISEFMALNGSTFLDEDGDSSDWIEIHNPSGAPVDLDGWYLTDDPRNLRKWRFPQTILEAGSYLVVFASGKDRGEPASELHTNFRLSGSGEYLALVRPDGIAREHEYGPRFPEQREGFSFGIGQELKIAPLVRAGSEARILIPADASLGTSWNGSGEPFDDSRWTRGSTGIGYLVSQPGFAARVFLAGASVDSLSTAEEVIRNPGLQAQVHAENAGAINYFNTGGAGHYGDDKPFPGTTIGEDVEDYVLEATATITIPSAGSWTFGVSSDDGFGLDVRGNGESFRIEYPSPRGPGDTVGVFNFTAAGAYDLRLVFYERGGGSEVELYAARGSYSAWSPAMRLIGDTAAGGLAAESLPVGSGPTSSFRNLIETDVQDSMYGQRSSAYVRMPFQVEDPSIYGSLALRMKYDDGFVAYLNGVEVARQNAPTSLSYSSLATADRSARQAVSYQDIDISGHLGLLRAGSNLLAFHALNDSPGSGDFLMHPELCEITVISMAMGFFAQPTPGEANSVVFTDFVADTKFDPDRGFFDAPLAVTITSATEGAEIRYTTDGSAPSPTSGQAYTGPIPITRTTTLRAAAFKADFVPTNVDTHTYIFLEDVLTQTGAGFPATWGGAVADYEMDPEVFDDPLYRESIRGDLRSIPSVSVVMSIDDLFGGARGIYSNPTGEGITWERPASVELIFPRGLEGLSGGDEGFHVNCAIRIYGGVGRIPEVPKHSFRLLFKGSYGPTKLTYPLFGDTATDQFDTLILRAGFNNSWVFNSPGEMVQAQYLRDQWIRDTQLAMGRPSPHGIFVHLYLNGLYWGLYNFVERPSASFAASYFGGDKEDWDALNSGEVIDGDRIAWNQMHELANAGLAPLADYQAIQQYLDVPNLIDYMLFNFYGGNLDWDGHNWYAARKREPGAGYKFFSWDAERTLEPVFGADRTGIDEADKPSRLYARLRANEEFLIQFADHSHRHLLNGGALSPEATEERYRRRAEEIYGAIVGESARWGDAHRATPFTRDVEWAAERDRLLSSYFPQRTNVLLSQLRAAGLYPDVEAPRFSRHGGRIPPGFPLVMTTSEGTIYYTLDGADPRLPGGTVSSGALVAGSVSNPVLLAKGATVRVRVPVDDSLALEWTSPDFDDSGWIEGITGVGFERSTGYESLISTDIGGAMYGLSASVYLRMEFSVTEPSTLAFLDLRIMYDDGFVAYLNGQAVAARNAPTPPAWNSAATANHDDAQAVVFERIELPDAVAFLKPGKNVLAIHGLNLTSTSSDLLILPELRATEAAGQGIPLEETTTVRSRTLLGGRWSPLNEAFFYIDIPLRITEIMYHPREPGAEGPWDSEEFEFVELQNVGSGTLNLTGFRLAGGIDYEFSSGIVSLPPDEVLLVVRNRAAFLERYPFVSAVIAGEYSRRLDNSRDTILLEGASGEPILTFEYSHSWYPETDGEGYSLIIVDPEAAPETWGELARWRPSLALDGSPGWVESRPPPAGGRQIPGNINQDFSLDISDAVSLLLRLFVGLPGPLPCAGDSISEGGNRSLVDVNGDGNVDVSDVIRLLSHLFRQGPPPSLGAGCVRIEGCPSVCPD